MNTAAQAQPGTPAPIQPQAELSGWRNYTRIMLLVYIAVVGIGILPAIASALGFLNILPPQSIFIALAMSRLVGLAEILTFLLAGIGVLVWFYRARANLARAGLEELAYSPGRSVGSFFVPIANLFVPFLSMRELHNRSHGEIPELSRSSVPDVASWWTCHLAGSLLLLVLLFVGVVDTMPGFFWTTPPIANVGLSILASILMVGSAWFMRKIIGEVTDAQRNLMNVGRTFE